MTTEMWARMPGRASPGVGVRISADPLGPVNQIVRLVRYGANGTTSQVKAALWRIPAGAKVELKRGWVYFPPPKRARSVAYGGFRLSAAGNAVDGYRVTVDGRTVLTASDSEIWPPTPAEPVPWPPSCPASGAAMSAEKRCRRCGHQGRLTPIHNRWVKRIDGYRCTGIQACNDRVRVLGKWTGKRVLRRSDADGTQWTIRRADRTAVSSSGQWFVLMCVYREHRGTSWHSTVVAAQAHTDELIASFRARDIEAYRDEPVVADDQLELA